MARVPASETTRKRIEAMISGEGEGVDKSELVRAAARLILEEALERRSATRWAGISTNMGRSQAAAIATATGSGA